jgi:inner membrane protein
MPAGYRLGMDTPTSPPSTASKYARRNAATLKLIFIAGLILVLQIPVHLVNQLRVERREARERLTPAIEQLSQHNVGTFEAYRIVERVMNYDALVAALVFTSFFLFEALCGLRLHAVHYGLVGAALCLFYLALLALGEFVGPDRAYLGAAVASSLLVVFYSAAILRSWLRAGIIATLLAGVYGVLYLVLQQENYALLAGTATLFMALAAVMFFSRNVEWDSDASGPKESAA